MRPPFPVPPRREGPTWLEIFAEPTRQLVDPRCCISRKRATSWMLWPRLRATAVGQPQPHDRATPAWLLGTAGGNAEPAQAADAKGRKWGCTGRGPSATNALGTWEPRAACVIPRDARRIGRDLGAGSASAAQSNGQAGDTAVQLLVFGNVHRDHTEPAGLEHGARGRCARRTSGPPMSRARQRARRSPRAPRGTTATGPGHRRVARSRRWCRPAGQ
jgi:hypothetical protein